MRYTPRQIVVRAREAAYLLLAALDHDAMVRRFLESYSNEYSRTGVIMQPTLFRELMGSVRREAILAMAIHLDEAVPRRLGITQRPAVSGNPSRGSKGKPLARGARRKGPAAESAASVRERVAEGQMLKLFREEFLIALGQALRWTEADFGEFARDYDLYQALTSRNASQSARGIRGAAAGPFADRCGLLVDPSMLEQARRAAGRFQVQLESAADGVLKKVFARQREN